MISSAKDFIDIDISAIEMFIDMNHKTLYCFYRDTSFQLKILMMKTLSLARNVFDRVGQKQNRCNLDTSLNLKTSSASADIPSL